MNHGLETVAKQVASSLEKNNNFEQVYPVEISLRRRADSKFLSFYAATNKNKMLSSRLNLFTSPWLILVHILTRTAILMPI